MGRWKTDRPKKVMMSLYIGEDMIARVREIAEASCDSNVQWALRYLIQLGIDDYDRQMSKWIFTRNEEDKRHETQEEN